MAKSSIKISKSKRGAFTKKAKGAKMGTQAFANKVLSAPKGKYSASTRRQANFAKNFGGKTGGHAHH